MKKLILSKSRLMYVTAELKIFFSLLILLFISVICAAQKIEFDTCGRVAVIETKENRLLPPNLGSFDGINSTLKSTAREILLEKAESARRIFSTGYYKPSLYNLYQHIWKKDSIEIVNYLDEIITSLENPGVANIKSKYGESFNKAFNTNLSDTANLFRWEEGIDKISGTLWSKDPLVGFFVNYYNNNLTDLKATSDLTKKELIIAATYYLLDQKNQVDILLERFKSPLNQEKFNKTFYDSLNLFHSKLYVEGYGLDKLSKTLGEKWFIQMFWLRGGEIRMNPLDVTIKDSIQKYPAISLLKHVKEEEITDEDDFYLENRLDTLDRYFKAAYLSNFIYEKKVNSVSIPKTEGYYSFSGSGKFDYGNKESLTDPEGTKGQKNLVVHNIPGKRKLGIRENLKAYNDRSAFQEGLDETVENLAKLAELYARLTPYGTWLNLLIPQPNYDNATIPQAIVPKPSKSDKIGGDRWSGVIEIKTPPKEVKLILQEIELKSVETSTFNSVLEFSLKLENIYDSSLFKMFAKDTLTMLEASDEETLKKLNAKLGIYLSLLIQEKAMDVEHDRFLIYSFLKIYNESSTPPVRALKYNRDNNATYYSDVIATTAIDSTVKNNVKLFTIDKSKDAKDSIVIADFAYKVAKHRKITLSAGLAYTLNSYNQSTAKSSNDTITISNNSQQYRFIVGLNFYPFDGLFNQHNEFVNKRNWKERTYVFVGVSIPEPLENVYLGAGVDLVPGLKVSVGLHITKNNSYFIQNNQIVEERLRYQIAGPFVALKVDPTSLVSALNIFTKKP